MCYFQLDRSQVFSAQIQCSPMWMDKSVEEKPRQVPEQNVSRLNWWFALLRRVNLDSGGRKTFPVKLNTFG